MENAADVLSRTVFGCFDCNCDLRIAKQFRSGFVDAGVALLCGFLLASGGQLSIRVLHSDLLHHADFKPQHDLHRQRAIGVDVHRGVRPYCPKVRPHVPWVHQLNDRNQFRIGRQYSERKCRGTTVQFALGGRRSQWHYYRNIFLLEAIRAQRGAHEKIKANVRRKELTKLTWGWRWGWREWHRNEDRKTRINWDR